VESTYFNYDLLDKNEPIIKKDGEYQGSMFLFNLFTGHLIDNFCRL